MTTALYERGKPIDAKLPTSRVIERFIPALQAADLSSSATKQAAVTQLRVIARDLQQAAVAVLGASTGIDNAASIHDAQQASEAAVDVLTRVLRDVRGY